MTDVDELDGLWHELLSEASAATPLTPDSARERVAARLRRRRHRRAARVGIVVSVFIVGIVGGAAGLAHQQGQTASAPGAAETLRIVDAPGGQLIISAPGRATSGHPPEITLAAGDVTFHIATETDGHPLQIQGVPAFGTTPGTRGDLERTVRLEPGTYKLYCTVPGHVEAGEELVLVVR